MWVCSLFNNQFNVDVLPSIAMVMLLMKASRSCALWCVFVVLLFSSTALLVIAAA